MSNLTSGAIFAEQLVGLGYGHPLWRPEPTKHGEVLIGDVGFVEESTFYRLFNAMRSKDDPVNSRGVPNDFHPLEVDDAQQRHVDDRFLPPGPQCSTSVSARSRTGGRSTSPDGANQELAYEFSCDGKRGAAAILGDFGRQELVLRSSTIREYMCRNHASWYAFASDKGYELEPSDIILVSGWVKTSEWAVVAFNKGRKPHSFSFAASPGHFSSATFDIPLESVMNTRFERRTGPVRSNSTRASKRLSTPIPIPSQTGPSDQCVFLRYYKLKTRPSRGESPGKPSRHSKPANDAAANTEDQVARSCFPLSLLKRRRKSPPSADHSSSSKGEAIRGKATAAMDLQEGPSSRLGWHLEVVPHGISLSPDPLDDILDYSLARSSATTAITSHDELYELCTPREWPRMKSVATYLKRKHPRVFVDASGASLVSDDPTVNVKKPTKSNGAVREREVHGAASSSSSSVVPPRGGTVPSMSVSKTTEHSTSYSLLTRASPDGYEDRRKSATANLSRTSSTRRSAEPAGSPPATMHSAFSNTASQQRTVAQPSIIVEKSQNPVPVRGQRDGSAVRKPRRGLFSSSKPR